MYSKINGIFVNNCNFLVCGSFGLVIKKSHELDRKGWKFFNNGMKYFTNEYSYFHATSFSSLKVSKSPKNFSWNSIAQKTNKILDKILPYEIHFLGVLRAMEFLEKMLNTDLLTFKGQLISKENSKLFIWTKKTKQKYFCSSALATKNGQIKKISDKLVIEILKLVF